MSKFKKIINRILFILIGILIGVSITVKAVSLVDSINVEYNKTTVKDALDTLYNTANAKVPSENSSCKNISLPNLGTSNEVGKKLVPVVITSDGKVKKVSATNENNEWYNYCLKQWANAVILNVADTYKEGDVIPESSIESYFVWIPKYKYKLWNVGSNVSNKGLHSIEIVFDETNTTDTSSSCATPMTSGATGKCKNGYYMTHPAFISLGVNGFWVGKFETLYNSSKSTIEIKPNVTSVRNFNFYTFFKKGYNYKQNLKSHMMKNTEWGAVAYLSHSVFGINGAIKTNNNSSYITGYGNTSAYNTDDGKLASTTGNISGIYDMSGGAWEYMATYTGNVGSSGFVNGSSTSTADNNINNPNYIKYFDKYNANSTHTSYENRILGDATGEMGPFAKSGSIYINQWYGELSNSLTTGYFLGRGGGPNYINYSGIFTFSGANGGNFDYSTFRVVVAPTN